MQQGLLDHKQQAAPDEAIHPRSGERAHDFVASHQPYVGGGEATVCEGEAYQPAEVLDVPHECRPVASLAVEVVPHHYHPAHRHRRQRPGGLGAPQSRAAREEGCAADVLIDGHDAR